jgi:predicted nucleic-acid-binding protein
MIGVDTNVLVRLLVNDDAARGQRARALMASDNDIFLAPTVLLEAEWVLRVAYRFNAPQIASFLRAALGLPRVRTHRPERVAAALLAYEAGLDFADALHAALGEDLTAFYTFDADFRKRAARVLAGVRVLAA